MPQICSLLMREAEAWRALFGLHQSVVAAAHQIASATSDAEVHFANAREVTETREANYCAALTQLASQCDHLAAEALRLRALRKTRATTDLQAIEMLIQAHTSETLAVGTALSSNCSVNVQAVTVDMRRSAQATKQQIQQVRALMQLLQDDSSMKGSIQIAYTPAGGETQMFSTEAVFQIIYKHSESLSEDALASALKELCGVHTADRTCDRSRTFVRRTSEGRRGDTPR